MAEISFKSVGVKSDDPQFKRSIGINPLGIKTPLELGNLESGLFKMHFTTQDQVQDNFRNLLLTNHGERLGRFGYGANLRPLATERTSGDEFDNEAMRRIRSAVEKSMPFIELTSFESFTEPSRDGVIGRVIIRVRYSARPLGISEAAIEVVLSTIG
tara:strand:+ start:1091 stop:1561 length:471 start_codon:yes stop_codon:yes gene_type:complete